MKSSFCLITSKNKSHIIFPLVFLLLNECGNQIVPLHTLDLLNIVKIHSRQENIAIVFYTTVSELGLGIDNAVFLKRRVLHKLNS